MCVCVAWCGTERKESLFVVVLSMTETRCSKRQSLFLDAFPSSRLVARRVSNERGEKDKCRRKLERGVRVCVSRV